MPGFVLPGINDDRDGAVTQGWVAPGNWNIMLPIDLDSNGNADTISYTTINTPEYEYEPYYFIAEPGIWELLAPVSGPTSSASTQYVRTEWRHWNPGINNEANTTIPVGLSVRGEVRIPELPALTSGGPSRICFAQFHGASSGQNMRLYFARQQESPAQYGVYFQDDLYGGPTGTATPTETAFQVIPQGSVGLNQWIEFHAVTVDDWKVVTCWLGETEYKVVQRNSDDWLAAPEVYVKAGTYLGVGAAGSTAGTKGTGQGRTQWNGAPVPSHGMPNLAVDNVWDWLTAEKCKPHTDSYLEMNFHKTNARVKSVRSVGQDTQGAPEVVLTWTGEMTGEQCGVGFINQAGLDADWSAPDWPGVDANGISWMNTGNIYHNGALLATHSSYVAGDTLRIRISGGKIGFKKNAEAWYELTVATLTGPLFAQAFASTAGLRVTADFAAWAYTAPASGLPRWKQAIDLAESGPAPANWNAKLSQAFTAGAKRLLVLAMGEVKSDGGYNAGARLVLNGVIQAQHDLQKRDTVPSDWREFAMFGVIPAGATQTAEIHRMTENYTRNLRLIAVEIPDEAVFAQSLAAEQQNGSSTMITATPDLVVPAGEWIILAQADFVIGDPAKMAKNQLITSGAQATDGFVNYLRYITAQDTHHRFHIWPRIAGEGGVLTAQETFNWSFAPNDSLSYLNISRKALLALPKSWLGDLGAITLAAESASSQSAGAEAVVLSLTQNVPAAADYLMLDSFTAEGASSSVSMYVRSYAGANLIGEYSFESPSTSVDRAMYAGGVAAVLQLTGNTTFEIRRAVEAAMTSKVKPRAALVVGKLGGALP